MTPVATREAWSTAETLTPMFRITCEVERTATGPDDAEVEWWLAQSMVHRHTTEDAGMFAHWLAQEVEAVWPDRNYEVSVQYRVLYTDTSKRGVTIRGRA